MTGAPPSADSDSRAFAVQAVLIAFVFAIAVTPAAVALQFCRTPENLVVAAALEMRRSGHWLLPTLEGEPRTAKPPLSTWITAIAIREQTLVGMAATDSVTRAAAYERLAWETRWPAIVISAATLLATAALGRVLLGTTAGGIASMLFCGSAVLVIRFAAEAATDTSLMLWVTVTNLMLAYAIFNSRIWFGCVGAGIAVGLALMSKGPVALVQSILPAIVFVCWRRRPLPPAGRWIMPLLAGLGCALLIALPWPIFVLLQNPSHQIHDWMVQIARQDDPSRVDPVWTYLLRLPAAVAPSVILLAVGLVRGWRSKRDTVLLAILFLLVPLLVMTLFKDRKDRYLLPMLPAAAVLCAAALRHDRDDAVVWLHRALLALIAIGLPVCGATRLLVGVDGRPWFSPAFAGGVVVLVVVIMSVAIAFDRPVAAETFGVMLIVQFAFFVGYQRSEGGRSDMFPLAQAIWSAAPDAEMINGQPTDIRTSVDLSIYLNRITRWMPSDQWRALPPGQRSRVVILLQHEHESPPVVADWSVLSSIARGKERWWALMLPRA